MSRAQILKSPLHQAALDWAEAGFHVFPCRMGRKEPACDNGVHDATRDPARIDAWWATNPNFNVGCAPHASGYAVLDADPPLGLQTLKSLETEHGALPGTLQVSTPRGGLHLWFEGDLPSTAQKLGPKLDTRGQGGYVLVPPSVISPGEYDNNKSGGIYAIKEDSEIAPLPEWVSTAIAASRVVQLAGTQDLDAPENLGRVRSLLNRLVAAGDVAIEGSGGDDRTFRLCCEVLDLGASKETGIDLVAELWNPHCNPPWTDEELETKFANAAAYRQNEIGAYAVGNAAEVFAGILRDMPSEQDPTSNMETGQASARIKFPILDLKAQAEQKEPEWIKPQLIPKLGQVLIYGQKKSFKSFLALDLALGVAAGAETFGHAGPPMPVLYAVGEGQNNLSRKHVPAWRMARMRNDDGFPFYVCPRLPFVASFGEAAEFVKAIKSAGIAPGMIFLDTVARSTLGLEENSAKEMGLFVAACDLIRDELQCTVIALHHSGKNPVNGSRGSNAIESAFDTVLEVKRHEKSLFVELWVRDQRSAAEREEPYRFEGHVIGPSLVFQPCEEAVYKAATEGEAIVTAKKIGAVLQAAGAYEYEAGITTEMLAKELGRSTQMDTAVLVKLVHATKKKNEAVRMLSGGDPLRWHLLARQA